jgi:hypothetical protein
MEPNDEQQNYDDLAAAMQQADALRAGCGGELPIGRPVRGFSARMFGTDTVT